MSVTVEQLERQKWEQDLMSGIECCVRQLDTSKDKSWLWPQADVPAHVARAFGEDGEEWAQRDKLGLVVASVSMMDLLAYGGPVVGRLLEILVDEIVKDERWRYEVLRMEMRVGTDKVSVRVSALR